MKDFGIQLTDNTENGELMDMKIVPVTDPSGLIVSGLALGNTLQQNKALILIAQPNDFKFDPTLGVGLEDSLLSDDLLEYRHRVREHFAKDGLKIKVLDLYTKERIDIQASYE